MESLESTVREFIVNNFLFGQDGAELTDDASLLEHGIIDSTGVLELVSFLEGGYQFKIDDEELIPENLYSISNLARFIRRKSADPSSLKEAARAG